MLSKIVSVAAGTTQTILFNATGAKRTSASNSGKPTITIIIAGGATATVSTRTAEGGTAVAVADGNLSGTISASKSDVVEGTIHSIDVTAAVATVTVEIAFPEDI